MSTWAAIAVGIIPSIGVGLVFFFALRAVIRADRNERAALARLEEESGDDATAASEDREDDAANGTAEPDASTEERPGE